METELEMTQMLKLADMDFKTAIITILEDIKENSLVINKTGKRKTYLSREPNGNARTEKHDTHKSSTG